MPAYPGCPGKKPFNGCSSRSSSSCGRESLRISGTVCFHGPVVVCVGDLNVLKALATTGGLASFFLVHQWTPGGRGVDAGFPVPVPVSVSVNAEFLVD